MSLDKHLLEIFVDTATTTNITLSGLQTIDGVAVADGRPVLVKDQTDASENGPYLARRGAWQRHPLASTGAAFGDIHRVFVTGGDTAPNKWFDLSAPYLGLNSNHVYVRLLGASGAADPAEDTDGRMWLGPAMVLPLSGTWTTIRSGTSTYLERTPEDATHHVAVGTPLPDRWNVTDRGIALSAVKPVYEITTASITDLTVLYTRVSFSATLAAHSLQAGTYSVPTRNTVGTYNWSYNITAPIYNNSSNDVWAVVLEIQGGASGGVVQLHGVDLRFRQTLLDTLP